MALYLQLGAREMSQHLRTLTVFVKDPGSVSRTSMLAQNVPEDLIPHLGSLGTKHAYGAYTYMQRNNHTHKNK